MNPLFKLVISIIIGISIYLIPCPEGLDPKAWHLFAIFVSMISGIILKSYPMGFIAFLGLLVSSFMGIITLEQGLSGFSKPIIWLVVLVFFVARGFIKTNLGTRVAYMFVKLLGKSSLGLSYGIAITELIIAPFMPSNSARTGGVMLPIIKSISEALGSSPQENTEKKIGAFLSQVCYHSNLITSAMFLTAMAANPIAQELAYKQNVSITWVSWFTASSVPGLISLFLIPLILYVIYPPELKALPDAHNLASKKLEAMGPISKNEWIMLGVFSLLLILWMIGESFGVTAPMAGLLGCAILVLLNIIDWKDILAESEAWHTFIWLAILVTISTYLEKLGFISWFSGSMGHFVSEWSWHAAFLTLALAYFYSHYFFASNTAHVTSMYAAFLAVSIAAGTPPLLAALVLAFFSSLFSSMTHYGTSAGAVIFGAGYVTLPAWWSNGLIISFVYIIIWLGIGGIWWKQLGIW